MLKNNNEKGGTGKLKNYWEKGVYVVDKKHADLPIYTIKREDGSSKKNKVVHRNNLMLCNSLLPEESVGDSVVSKRKKKPKAKQKDNLKAVHASVAEDGREEESDSDQEVVLIREEIEDHRNMDIDSELLESERVVLLENDEEGVSAETENLDESAEADDSNELAGVDNEVTVDTDLPEVDSESEGIDMDVSGTSGESTIGNDSVLTIPYEDESALYDTDDDSETVVRKSSRRVVAPRELTYNDLGEPVWERRSFRQ